ncbi:Hypothetical_protein [Hexamita inflata]|uniref:Hypothetical_protein n=1 Tax=Hexamita inflata TaxID=28002 RepID=A0AA86PVL4_9EUKA|nr:Hypothetical protein HINF_LOCUS29800 [Hexamita inflata]
MYGAQGTFQRVFILNMQKQCVFIIVCILLQTSNYIELYNEMYRISINRPYAFLTYVCSFLSSMSCDDLSLIKPHPHRIILSSSNANTIMPINLLCKPKEITSKEKQRSENQF